MSKEICEIKCCRREVGRPITLSADVIKDIKISFSEDSILVIRGKKSVNVYHPLRYTASGCLVCNTYFKEDSK